MGLFSNHFEKEGPGVSKDEPRKVGVRRFFEVLFRDFGGLVKLNLLFFICALPSAALFAVGLFWLPAVLLPISIVAAFPIGGAYTAVLLGISKMLRDEHAFIWYDFKRKFVENIRGSMLPGIICAALVYAQVYAIMGVLSGELAFGLDWLIMDIIAALIFGMVSPYFFLQAGYIDLKTTALLKNSVFLAFRFFPRSFMGAVLASVFWALFAWFFPASLPLVLVIPFLTFTLSWLLMLMWIWKPVNELFKIEETLKNREDAELAAVHLERRTGGAAE
jgi:hypothetical protein